MVSRTIQYTSSYWLDFMYLNIFHARKAWETQQKKCRRWESKHCSRNDVSGRSWFTTVLFWALKLVVLIISITFSCRIYTSIGAYYPDFEYFVNFGKLTESLAYDAIRRWCWHQSCRGEWLINDEPACSERYEGYSCFNEFIRWRGDIGAWKQVNRDLGTSRLSSQARGTQDISAGMLQIGYRILIPSA